jgi:hypothetical protein
MSVLDDDQDEVGEEEEAISTEDVFEDEALAEQAASELDEAQDGALDANDADGKSSASENNAPKDEDQSASS